VCVNDVTRDMFYLTDRLRKHLPWALLAGAALRLFFVWRFPATAGDTDVYAQFARNWLDHGVYGLTINGQVVPADLRTPGYPAFLALVYLFLGRGWQAVLLAQVVLDLGTCVLTAALAAALVPAESRSRIGVPALWLAALCPFVANYCAVPLSEVLTTFLTTAALLWLIKSIRTSDSEAVLQEHRRRAWIHWLVAGILVGLGTLVRPETPLLLVAAAIVLLVHWRRRVNWPKLVRAGVLLAVGLVLPLLPWGARNWVRFHHLQVLAARYAQMPGEFVPTGFYSWTKTWLWRFRDVYAVFWKYDEEPLAIENFPAYAFDTPEERARVAALLTEYNEIVTATPEFDRVFAQLAAERTARQPLRTYLWVPLRRSFAIWFTPRIELLPFSGHLWPLYKQWDEDRLDFCVTMFFGLINLVYVSLAILGLRQALRLWKATDASFRVGLALLIAYLLLRTAFLTQVESPEPRYVVECFPILCVLGALAWLRPAQKGA
jgi:4-amino-4-deoxy-L-arabinose transferase-like glycosyltransferase